jgi:para-nitrobenzyl esterase
MRLYSAVLAALIAPALASAAPATADPLIVRTAAGSVLGAFENVTAGAGTTRSSRARSFKGIPFGKVERWQPPLPAEPWQQIRPALAFGATCETAEQCLFANVNTPWPLRPDVPGKGLAVMLFIHGGCNKGGAGSKFRTEELVAAAQDVIVVTINYRLGIFGWLGGKEVAGHTKDGSSGNFGTQDQRAGMQWVQDNIAAFGDSNPMRACCFVAAI